LTGSQRPLGVLVVFPFNRRRILLPEQRHLLETFASQLALALERSRLAAQAEEAKVAARAEILRNTLLASISHDLRTPLAVITAAASALADRNLALEPAARASLATSIVARSRDMTQLIANVLDLIRFETGPVALHRDWQMLEDLVNAARERLSGSLEGRELRIQLAADLPPVHVDGALITQVLANLFDNAVRHAPQGRLIVVSAAPEERLLHVMVDDDGPGLPPGDPERLFVKFQRGREESEIPGAGLGLAICRAIVEAHGGRIHARSLAGGGARFEFTLPLETQA
jgi:two-component system sensor histidine kinase KdpD